LSARTQAFWIIRAGDQARRDLELAQLGREPLERRRARQQLALKMSEGLW
jgi:hypothetical protein